MFLFNDNSRQTITVLRKGVRDWTGDKVSGELDESHKIDNVIVEWDSTVQERFQRDETTFTGFLYMNTGSDILATDLIELATGERVTVSGKPFVAALGLVSGMAVKFRGVVSQ